MLLKTGNQIKTETKGKITLENEFLNVKEYLEILKTIETINISFESEKLLNEIEEDLFYFGGGAKYYAFFEIKTIEDIEYFRIYDYTDEDDPTAKDGENFALMTLKDLYELVKYQNKVI